MKKFKYFLISFILFLLPVFVSAKTDYIDKVYDIVGEQKLENLTIYLFHLDGCRHCKLANAYLSKLEKKYNDKIVVRRYEATHFEKIADVGYRFNTSFTGFPVIIIEDKYYVGFSKGVENEIDELVDNKENESFRREHVTLPFLGKVEANEVSIPLAAILLGTVDGFNPCAMWVLLFLINMLFNMKDRRKMWILGFTFLFTSALVYFLAMLGLSFALSFTSIIFMRVIIALVAIIGGIVNLIGYIKTPKDGCIVVNENKRKKYFKQIKKFTSEQNLWIAITGVILLALSVNVVELACSAGFPTIFISILELNKVALISKVLYILLYIIFYLIDDLVIFVIAMVSLKITGITTKYNKISKLVGGIIMVLIGLLLIFKPEWIMLNF